MKKLAKELHKLARKNAKEETSMRDLKTTFGQLIKLKWDHCPLKLEIFSLNMHGLNL